LISPVGILRRTELEVKEKLDAPQKYSLRLPLVRRKFGPRLPNSLPQANRGTNDSTKNHKLLVRHVEQLASNTIAGVASKAKSEEGDRRTENGATECRQSSVKKYF
jgi:hypothetical protein